MNNRQIIQKLYRRKEKKMNIDFFLDTLCMTGNNKFEIYQSIVSNKNLLTIHSYESQNYRINHANHSDDLI